MKHLSFIIGLVLCASCSTRSGLDEHEALCRISGEGFFAKNVRVCHVWSDMWNGDAYQEINVKNGRFDAEVILDTNQVYEICIPHPEYGYATYRTAKFFFSKDGVIFGEQRAVDGDRVIIVEPGGRNKVICDYVNHRDSIFMDRYVDLMVSQDSLNDIGQMYDPHWSRLCEMQNDENLPQTLRDSITLEVNKMSMSGEHRTASGQKWQQEWNRYRSAKQDYDFDHLSASDPDPMSLYLIMENIHKSKDISGDISRWLNIYDLRFKAISPTDRMHELIAAEREDASMVEGRHYIDFTLQDRSGVEHTLSELIEGKTAVLELWASWCRSCRVTAKSFKPLYEKYKDSGFTVVGIAREYRDTEKWIM